MIENNIKLFESAYSSFVEGLKLFESSEWYEKDNLFHKYEDSLQDAVDLYFKLVESSSSYSYDDLLTAELQNTIFFEKGRYSEFDVNYSDHFLNEVFSLSWFRLIFFCRVLEARPVEKDITDELCALGLWLMSSDLWSLTYLIIERLAEYENPEGLSLVEKYAIRLSSEEEYYHSAIGESIYEYLFSLDRRSAFEFLEKIKPRLKGDLELFLNTIVFK